MMKANVAFSKDSLEYIIQRMLKVQALINFSVLMNYSSTVYPIVSYFGNPTHTSINIEFLEDSSA